jgi:hypothetical protein
VTQARRQRFEAVAGTLTRRRFIGAGLLASAAALGTTTRAWAGMTDVRASADGTHGGPFTCGLVQWRSWPAAPERAREDLARNAERMRGVIDVHAGRCDWLAFDDCALTGRTPLIDRGARSALAIDANDAVVRQLARAAVQARCWLSFGALYTARTPDVDVGDAVVAISPEGKVHIRPMRPVAIRPLDLPVVDTAWGRIALLPHEAAPRIVRACLAEDASMLITMNSGPTPPADAAHPGIELAAHAGVPVLELRGSAPWAEPGCSIDWMGGTRARDARGNVIGECRHAAEEVLIVTVQSATSAA